MTTWAIPSAAFTATSEDAGTGLVGTIGVRISNPQTDTDTVARTTSGIAEYPAGSGIYIASLTAPAVAGSYLVIWDDGSGNYATDDLWVSQVSPANLPGANLYITSAQLKATLTMNGTTFADADLNIAVSAASRAIDTMCGRRFWLDANATKVRYYTPTNCRWVQIDDLVALTSVTIDRTGTGSFSETWVQGTDFVLEPFNGPAEQPARPYEQIRVRRYSGQYLPECVEQSVKVTGQFGWSAVPDDVTAATGILAAKLLKRSREAPFGIVQAGIDGAAMRIARTDPDVYTLLRNYDRTVVIV